MNIDVYLYYIYIYRDKALYLSIYKYIDKSNWILIGRTEIKIIYIYIISNIYFFSLFRNEVGWEEGDQI